LGLMITVLQWEWDQDRARLQETDATRWLKIVISMLTAIQVLQICDYYWTELSIQSQKVKERALKKTRDLKNLFQSKAPGKKASYFIVLRSSYIIHLFLAEVVVTLPHPAVFLPLRVMKILSLTMFLRLYIVFRVIRDFSEIYIRRNDLAKIPGYSSATHPAFDTFLCSKMLIYKNPIRTICLCTFASWLILAYCVYVFEREAQPLDFSFPVAFYLIMNSMLTGWGNDTFDEYDPITWSSKLTSLLAVVVGVFWFAWLIDHIHTRMQPSRFQLVAQEYLTKANIMKHQRDAAARLIQLVWRYNRWRKETKQHNLSKVLRKAQRETFTLKYLQIVHNAKKFRRDKRRDGEDVSFHQPIEQPRSDMKRELIKEFAKLLEEQKNQIIKELTEKNIKPVATKTEKVEPIE